MAASRATCSWGSRSWTRFAELPTDGLGYRVSGTGSLPVTPDARYPIPGTWYLRRKAAGGVNLVIASSHGGLVCSHEIRPAQRPPGVDRRAPPTGTRRRAAGDPLPGQPGVVRAGAPVPGGPHRNRPDCPARALGRVRRGEGATQRCLRQPARGGYRRQAAGAREGRPGLGRPVRPAHRRVSLRLHRPDGRPVGAFGRRVPPRVALARASVYIRVSSSEAPNPCRGFSWRLNSVTPPPS